MKLLLITFFYRFVLVFTTESEGCRCVEKPLHEAFCDADFAILAKVVSPLRVQEYQRHLLNFRVEAKAVFRQRTMIFTPGSSRVIFTPRSADLCHANVNRNQLFLLGGSIKRNSIFVTSCGLIKKWHKLPHIIRKAIRHQRLSCRCMVQGCHGEQCLVRKGRPNSHSCERVSKYMKSCYYNNGVCTWKRGRCKWAKRSAKLLTHCLARKFLGNNVHPKS